MIYSYSLHGRGPWSVLCAKRGVLAICSSRSTWPTARKTIRRRKTSSRGFVAGSNRGRPALRVRRSGRRWSSRTLPGGPSSKEASPSSAGSVAPATFPCECRHAFRGVAVFNFRLLIVVVPAVVQQTHASACPYLRQLPNHVYNRGHQ